MCFVDRGWGLHSLDDIPAGGFICVYVGQLLTEQGANEVTHYHTRCQHEHALDHGEHLHHRDFHRFDFQQ